MEIKSKIFKRKSKSDRRAGKWILRIDYADPVTNQKRTKETQFDRKNDAVDHRPEMIAKLQQTQGRIHAGAKMSFTDLCDFSKRHFYKRAVIAEGRKIDGVRSHKTIWGFLDTLGQFFGAKKIGQITPSDLRAYRVWRLGRPNARPHKDASVSLATVNRELSAMRRMMKHAFHEGWVERDIFAGAKVIDVDAEQARTRLLTANEETLLLAACEGTRQVTYRRKMRGKMLEVSAQSDVYNKYLKTVILLALDSAMRRGEILKLRWQDLDLDNGTILIVGTHTKTEKERLAPLTDRTIAELRNLPSFGTSGPVFPFSDFKRSWATAKRIAGIGDLRFHDLRRTAITKFNMKGVPLATAGKIAGHARLETTMKHYIGTDEEIVRDVARRLNLDDPGDSKPEFVN